MENLETEVLYLHEGFDDDEDDGDIMMDEDHPMWRSERITLNSVGIDIGSSTSHLIFSRLTLRRQGIALSSRFVVVKREMLHESPILLTPYIDKTTIDTDKLDEFIQQSYRESGLTPNDIDTGAIIVTGEAAKKEERRGHLGAILGSSREVRLRHSGAQPGGDSGVLRFGRSPHDHARRRRLYRYECRRGRWNEQDSDCSIG